jgi:hypothetical protein
MYDRGGSDELIKHQLIPHHETDLALLVATHHEQHKDEWIWLPKSRISYKDDFAMGDVIEIGIPRWLCEKKGL